MKWWLAMEWRATMAKKRPKISLAQPVQPRTGDMEKLFATEGDVEQASGLQLLSIRLDAIAPDAEQPRRTFPDDSLQELSDSIKQDGVIQPIEVTERENGRFVIVHGERRWRAAELAGLETIPAVVRRRDYDLVTRLVRQLVENIQREDLNDVDRAAGLLRLREMLQAELDAKAADEESKKGHSPWARTITWAKVGKRLGYSRQRIHQLIRLLDLPNVIKEDVRAGKLSERDTRIYQGLKPRQQRDLHKARYAEKLAQKELKQISTQLKAEPAKTVTEAILEVRNPRPETRNEQRVESTFEAGQDSSRLDATGSALRNQSWQEGGVLPARQNKPTSIDRLDWVRGHLARVQRQGLSAAERKEIVRLLKLIQEDVTSLLAALEGEIEEA
jgi:ParB family chromosome partitioning protein